jgi:glycosyltransferase involved in cell wall biosynthesis
MHYLILLNRKFPFGSGETFLENEIGILAQHFDKVLIFPSDACIGDNPTRLIQDPNVSALPFETLPLTIRKLMYVIAGAPLILKRNGNPLLWNLQSSYFEKAGRQQAVKILKVLDRIGLEPEDKITVYSYWLHINAYVALLLKETLSYRHEFIKTVSRAHGFDIYEELNPSKSLPNRIELLSGLDSVLPCSRQGADYLKSKYPEYGEKVRSVYLGTNDFGLNKASSDGILRVVSCSRLSSIKRVEMIAEALLYLDKNDIVFEWIHIGGGEGEKSLRKIISNYHCGNGMITGSVKNSDVYNYYKTHTFDIFLNASFSEGLPVSMMEAASFGIPIIATDVGGVSEIVVNDTNGYLLPRDCTSYDFFNKLRDFQQKSYHDRQKMRNQSREIWIDNFQAKQNYEFFSANLLKLGK